MTLTTSPKLGAYAALGAAGLLVALIWGYPEAAVLGLPLEVVHTGDVRLERELAQLCIFESA